LAVKKVDMKVGMTADMKAINWVYETVARKVHMMVE
jgi:hypothetical protein